jgi:hypothetical protein
MRANDRKTLITAVKIATMPLFLVLAITMRRIFWRRATAIRTMGHRRQSLPNAQRRSWLSQLDKDEAVSQSAQRNAVELPGYV